MSDIRYAHTQSLKTARLHDHRHHHARPRHRRQHRDLQRHQRPPAETPSVPRSRSRRRYLGQISQPRREHNEVTVANYLDWQAQTQSFEQLALYRWWSANLTGVDPPERIQGFLVTANFLDATGIKPIMGRNFLAGRKSTRQGRGRDHHSQPVAKTFRRRSKHSQQNDHHQQHHAHGRRRDAASISTFRKAPNSMRRCR